MGKRRKDLSGAFNAKSASRRKQGASLLKSKNGSNNGNSKKKHRLLTGLSNPFETRENRKQKHTVLNKKVKGATRNVALARSLAHEKRKRTLLTEFHQSSKANSFMDKRFGEKDKSMTEEEKILERFKRLRSKKDLYNLSDTDQRKRQSQLTHLGQSLNSQDENNQDMKEFEKMMREEGLEDDDMEERFDASELMERLKNHSTTEDRESKSKKDVMQEVIAKAKMFKLERQREKEQDDDERERLDEAFKDLVTQGAFLFAPTKKEKKEQEMKEMMDRLKNKADGSGTDSSTPTAAPPPAELTQKEQDDEAYDSTLRSLHFEARAAASDKTLKPEEIAKREREKLEEQQKELERRMKGILSDDEDSDDEQRGKKRRKKKKAEKDPFFDMLGKTDDDDDDDDEDDDDEDDDDDDDDDEDDSDLDELLAAHLEKQQEEMGKEEKKKNEKMKKKRKRAGIDERANVIKQAKGELPFLIDVPEDHIEFLELVQNYPVKKIEEIVLRIRKGNSIHLLAENRGKMKAFLDILLDHMILIVEQRAAGTCELDDVEASFVVDTILGNLLSLSRDIPSESAQVFVRRVSRMQVVLGQQLSSASKGGKNGGGDYGSEIVREARPGEATKRKKGGHKGAKGRARVAQEKEEEDYEINLLGGTIRVSDARCWPSPGDFALLKAVLKIFPATDFRHPVISPAQLLLGQYLTQCPIRGPRDVIACLCTCQMMLEFVKGAKRFSPELALALEGISLQAFSCFKSLNVAKNNYQRWVLPQITISGRKFQGCSQLDWLRRGILGLLQQQQPKEQKQQEQQQDANRNAILQLHSLSYGENEATPDLQLCFCIVNALGSLCTQFADCVSDLSSGDVLLEPLLLAFHSGRLLQSKDNDDSKSLLKTRINQVASKLEKAMESCGCERKPMRLMEAGPKTIQSIEPLFNENYRWSKDGHDPDRVRAEMKKLKKSVNRERKGVARELRKDAQFLSEQRDASKEKRMRELQAERQRNYNIITNQAGEFDKAVREFGARGGGASRADLRGRRRK